MCAQEPPLYERYHAMAHGQRIVSDRRLGARDGVIESGKLEPVVTCESIGHHVAANINQLRYRREQGYSLGVGDHQEPGSTNGAQFRLSPVLANLDCNEDEGLPGSPAAAFSPLPHAADVCDRRRGCRDQTVPIPK